MKISAQIILCLSVYFSACFFSIGLLADEVGSEWNLRRDREGIQVYTSKIEGSRYDAVLSKTIVENIRLSALVALVNDAEACTQWADKCVESFVYEKISETESLVYLHNDLPFPVKDRDILSRVIWEQNLETLEVLMTSEATVDIMPFSKGKLRLLEANISWRFKPLLTGGIEITNQAHINPGSKLPGWVTNMLLVDTPYKTIKSFVAEAKKPKYQNIEVSFIKNP